MGQRMTTIQEQIHADRRRWLSLVAKGGALTSLVYTSPLAAAVVANRLAAANPTKKFILLYHPGGGARGYINTVAVKPFEPFGSSVAALTMTINKPGNHGLIFMSAGANSFYPSELNSSTIDQQIANTIGHLTPLNSLQLGVQIDHFPDLSRNQGKAKPPITSPQLAVNALLTQFSSTPVGDGVGRYERHKAILAAHQAGLTPLVNRIGADERFKLEEHIAALENYQLKLEQNNQLFGTGPCGNITYTQGTSPLNLYRAQGDIAVTALACGMTNVVSIQFNNTQETWLANDGTPDAVPVVGDMAQVINGGTQFRYYAALNEYMNKGVAHIVNKLIQAGIFQDTVVLCVTEMGDTSNNSPDAGPITVASGITGFKGGLRNVGKDHYEIFPDVVHLLGLEWAVGQTIYKYSGGGIVV